MKPIYTTGHIGPDGTMTVQLPPALAGRDADVVVTPREMHNGAPVFLGMSRDKEEARRERLERAWGSMPDLERPPQGEFTPRPPLS